MISRAVLNAIAWLAGRGDTALGTVRVGLWMAKQLDKIEYHADAAALRRDAEELFDTLIDERCAGLALRAREAEERALRELFK